MMNHVDPFNGLSPAEAERLAMLAEEAGEIVQVVGKILRHGYESWHPSDPSTTNRMLLSKEVADLCGVVTMMEGDFDPTVGDAVEDVIAKKLRYSHHQSAPA
jgi:hypothetical protein